MFHTYFLNFIVILNTDTFFPEILSAPNSTTVFLDQSAVFTCETDGGLFGWRINGTRLQTLPPEIRNDVMVSVTNTAGGSTVERLTIPARAEYNGTRVQCLVGVFGGSSDESENATLKIQGRSYTIYLLDKIKNEVGISILPSFLLRSPHKSRRSLCY